MNRSSKSGRVAALSYSFHCTGMVRNAVALYAVTTAVTCFSVPVEFICMLVTT